MTCKISATLRRSSAKEMKQGASTYKQHISSVDFEDDNGTDDGGFSSVAALFQNYLESREE